MLHAAAPDEIGLPLLLVDEGYSPYPWAKTSIMSGTRA